MGILDISFLKKVNINMLLPIGWLRIPLLKILIQISITLFCIRMITLRILSGRILCGEQIR